MRLERPSKVLREARPWLAFGSEDLTALDLIGRHCPPNVADQMTEMLDAMPQTVPPNIADHQRPVIDRLTGKPQYQYAVVPARSKESRRSP